MSRVKHSYDCRWQRYTFRKMMHAGMCYQTVLLLWITLSCVSSGNTTDCTPLGQNVIKCEIVEKSTCLMDGPRGEHTLSEVTILLAERYAYSRDGQKLIDITVTWKPPSSTELNFTTGYILRYKYTQLNDIIYNPPGIICRHLRIQSIYPSVTSRDSDITFNYTLTTKDIGYESSDLRVEIFTTPFPLYEPERFQIQYIVPRTTASPSTQLQHTTPELNVSNDANVEDKSPNRDIVSAKPSLEEPEVFSLWWVLLLGIIVLALIVTTIVLVKRRKFKKQQDIESLKLKSPIARPRVCICYTPATDMYKQLYDILSSVIENYLYCDVISYTGASDSSHLLSSNRVIVVSCNELHDAYLTFNSSLKDKIESLPAQLIPVKRLLESTLQNRSNLPLYVVTFSSLKNGWLSDLQQPKKIYTLPGQLQELFCGINLNLPNDKVRERWGDFQASILMTELDAVLQRIALNNSIITPLNGPAEDSITVDTAYFTGTHMNSGLNSQAVTSSNHVLYPKSESHLSSYPNSPVRTLYGPNTYDRIISNPPESHIYETPAITRQVSDAPLLEDVVTVRM